MTRRDRWAAGLALLVVALGTAVTVGVVLRSRPPAAADLDLDEPEPEPGAPIALQSHEVAALVRRLADPPPAPAGARELLEARPREARDALLAALRDPGMRIDHPGNAPPGIAHVLWLLSLQPDDRTLRAVRELADDPVAAVRGGVARVLGRAGRDEDVERLVRLLDDASEVVRSDAAFAVCQCLEDGRGSNGWGAALFEPLAGALRRSGREYHGTVPGRLLVLDRPRALALLQEPAMLRPDLGALDDVLGALREEKVRLPVDTALTLLEGLEARGLPARGDDDPRGALLELLATDADPRVDAALRRCASAGGAYTAYVAAEALCERAGLDPDGVVDATPEDALSPAQRVFQRVRAYDYHVDNGGHRQLYASADGRHAVETVAALRAIGAGKSADLLERANAELGPNGPPRDDDAREAALEAIPKRPGEQFLLERYDDEAYAARHLEPVMARAYLHALAHPDEFRRRRKPRRSTTGRSGRSELVVSRHITVSNRERSLRPYRSRRPARLGA